MVFLSGDGQLDRLRKILANEDWTNTCDDRTALLVRFLNLAKVSIHGVLGELDPDIFSTIWGPDLLRTKLRNGVVVDLSFNQQGANSTQEASSQIQQSNPEMASLSRDFPGSLVLRFLRERPRLHFFIVDGVHAFHEEPDHPRGIIPACLARYSDKTWGRETVQRYESEVVPVSNLIVFS